jgi:predicted nucleic acid-binding protein
LSRYVVDANVVAKWFVPERLSEQALRLLDGAHELATPDLMWPEIGNVLWKKARARELTRRQAGRILEALEQCPLTVFPSRLLLESALEIALRTERTVYDSLYLALAVALECRLATADERLANALASGPLAGNIVWVGTAGAIT